jgi:predicted small metal-binding protein
MFEFVCDRVIPGCTHVERGDTYEKVLEQAMDHLQGHHGMDYIDKSWEERVRSDGIMVLPPH